MWPERREFQSSGVIIRHASYLAIGNRSNRALNPSHALPTPCCVIIVRHGLCSPRPAYPSTLRRQQPYQYSRRPPKLTARFGVSSYLVMLTLSRSIVNFTPPAHLYSRIPLCPGANERQDRFLFWARANAISALPSPCESANSSQPHHGSCMAMNLAGATIQPCRFSIGIPRPGLCGQRSNQSTSHTPAALGIRPRLTTLQQKASRVISDW